MIRAGTRTSRLARWQTGHVLALLGAAWPGLKTASVDFTTEGDRNLDVPLPEIGGKGIFTAELEAALLRGEIDLAVHSLKDLPTRSSEGIVVGAVPGRADVRDTLVGAALSDLPAGAVIGTSSTRRAAQLLRLRPGLEVRSVRGNLPTRLRKSRDGSYDAVVIAAAGLERLGMLSKAAQVFEPEEMLPAPGQGAIGVQCRADDARMRELLAAIQNMDAEKATSSERAFLAHLQAGCSSPVGALAQVTDGMISLRGVVLSLAGDREIRTSGSGTDPVALGLSLADEVLRRGAAELIHG